MVIRAGLSCRPPMLRCTVDELVALALRWMKPEYLVGPESAESERRPGHDNVFGFELAFQVELLGRRHIALGNTKPKGRA